MLKQTGKHPPVKIDRCVGYNHEAIQSLLSGPAEKALRKAGVGQGTEVLLKPNLLGRFAPERAVTTHPVIVSAIASLLSDMGAVILLGDSPGDTSRFDAVILECGLVPVIEKFNIRVVEFETAGVVKKLSPEGAAYHISRIPFEVQTVVNLAKLKTHILTSYTGAVKNLFGCIPGIKKQEYHRKAPGSKAFAVFLRDIYSILEDRISFHVLDGITGMEGAGPSAGKPADFNLLLCSESGVTLDFAGASILGIDPETIHYLEGMGVSSDDIEISGGKDLSEFCVEDAAVNQVIRLSRLTGKIPPAIGRLNEKFLWSRPSIDQSKCKGCLVCVERCPVSDISVKDGGLAEIDHKNCIKCMCCHELCPESAIFIQKSPVLRYGKIVKKAVKILAR